MSNKNISTLGSLRKVLEDDRRKDLEDIRKDINKINECFAVLACQFAIGAGVKTGLDILRKDKENE